MMAQSIASTNARMARARAARASVSLPGVEEEPQYCCDVCETLMSEESDMAINERITSQLNYEVRLQDAYNFYR